MRPGPIPWSLTDARTGFLPVVFGVVVLGWGWWESSGTGVLDEQTTAVAFSLLAAGVALAGCFGWIAAGRRAVSVRRREVVERLEASGVLGPVAVAGTGGIRRLVTVPGTTRYHRADCVLVRGKATERLALDGTAPVASPCEMCRP